MSTKIVVILYGSSHFKEAWKYFQSRFWEEWTRVECQYSRKRFKKIDFFAPGGQKFDTNFFANFKVNVLEWEQKGWAQIHLIVLGDNNLRETIEREHVQDQIKIKFDQNEALNE